MAFHALTDTERRVLYCESEIGNAATLDAGATTFVVIKAYNHSAVHATGTAASTLKTECVGVDPTITAA